MAMRRGARGGAAGRALALLVGACLAAPAFASGPAEHSPILVADPGSGATVVIWSRDDATGKLAWARQEGSGWGPAHDLTFGPGLDFSPAVGISSTGTWLFWQGEKGQIFSAPIDLSRGNLLAVPRAIAHRSDARTHPAGGASGGSLTGHGLLGTGIVGGLGGGTIRPEGGSDTPIILGPCDPVNPVQPCVPVTGGTGPGSRDIPPQINPEGGSDVPIIGVTGTGTAGSSTTTNGDSLTVTSDPNCNSQMVTLTEGRSILVIEFRGSGEVLSQTRVRVVQGIDPAEAAAVAGDYFLRATCH